MVKDRVFGLDILRAAAILLVIISHTMYLLPVSEPTKDIFLICCGFAGVEIFFVLSGFLIGRIFLDLLAKKSLTFAMVKNFWIRRWFRTLPAYFLCMIFYIGMFYYIEHKSPFSDSYNLLYFVFLQNFVAAPPHFYREAWSLSVEEWFYLLLPAWIWFFYKVIKMKNAVLSGIITCIIAVTLLRVVVVLLYDPVWNLGVRAIVPLRLDTLMTGVLTAYIYIHHRESWRKYARICFIAGVIVTLAATGWVYIDVVRHPQAAGFFSK
ncbi:MAG: acyltransferase, partial [Chitinophagaceae bacterium]